MALTCPNCNRRYLSDSVFCQECGEALVPAHPPWRKPAITGAAVLVFAAAMWSALDYIQSNLKNNVSPVFGLPSIDPVKKEVTVPVTIRNNSMFDFKLDSVKCEARILGLEATCTEAGLPLSIAKDKEGNFTLQVQMTLSDPTSASLVTLAHADMQVLGIPVGQDFDPPSTFTLDSSMIRDALLPVVPQAVPLPKPLKTEEKQTPKRKSDSNSTGFITDKGKASSLSNQLDNFTH
jgi:hypothetical protein